MPSKVKQKYRVISFIRRNFLPLLGIIYFIYSLLLIFRSSFVIGGVRYFTLFDDEMISMRYAKNLAHGFGLVWNPHGPRVEGFTNLLWVLYMTIFHLLPIPLSKTSFFIQLTGALLLLINGFFVWKITKLLSGNSFFASCISVLFTLFYFPLNNWGVILGTEVSALTTILTCACYLVLQNLKKGTFSHILYPLLAAGTLIRLDFFIPALVILFFLIAVDKKHRIYHISWGLGSLGIVTFAQTAFREWYYHDYFPNTYYLKMTGSPLLIRILRGIYVTVKSFNFMLLIFAFIPFLLQRKKEQLLLVLLFLAQVGYSIYVGGDAWEQYGGSNRYTSIAMPMLFILFAMSAQIITGPIKNELRQKRSLRYIGILVLLISFISFNAISDNTPLQMFLLKGAIVINENRSSVEGALILQKRTKQNAKIAVTWAGVLPYFTDRTFIDELGKNDWKIAHEKASTTCDGGVLRNLLCFWPGHMKWDSDYSFNQLKPDIVVQYMGVDDLRILNKDYRIDPVIGMRVRKGSTALIE